MASAARGELAEPEIIREVLLGMFRPGRKKLESTLEAYFAPGVELRNPFYAITGRDKLYNLLRFWEIVFDDRVEVVDTAVHGNRALARVKHFLVPRPLAALPQPLLHVVTFPFVVNAEFAFEDTPRGKKVVRIHDDVSLYTLLYNIPLAGAAWHNLVEPLVGQTLALAGAGMDWALPHVDRLLREYTSHDWGLARL